MEKRILFSEKAPFPIGPYSQGVSAVGETVFLSGQIPLKSDGTMVSGSVADEVRQIVDNISSVLNSAGLSLDHIVKTTVYLTDMNIFTEFNEAYAKYFGESKPARSTVEVSRLPKDSRIEIEAIAVG